VLRGKGDTETGRRDGTQQNGENCWCNIGPRRYVTEYPEWGLNNHHDGWRVEFFYVAFEDKQLKKKKAAKEGKVLELASHPGEGLKLEQGGEVEGHPWYRVRRVPLD